MNDKSQRTDTQELDEATDLNTDRTDRRATSVTKDDRVKAAQHKVKNTWREEYAPW